MCGLRPMCGGVSKRSDQDAVGMRLKQEGLGGWMNDRNRKKGE